MAKSISFEIRNRKNIKVEKKVVTIARVYDIISVTYHKEDIM